MSTANSASNMSPRYLEWLRQERRGRLTVRTMQLLILVVFLVLWEALPRLQIINGGAESIDIFCLKSDAERVSNGSVRPEAPQPMKAAEWASWRAR